MTTINHDLNVEMYKICVNSSLAREKSPARIAQLHDNTPSRKNITHHCVSLTGITEYSELCSPSGVSG